VPREAHLFHESGGSPVRAYLLMKAEGSANVPPMWVDRARKSRKSDESRVGAIVKKTKGRIRFTKDLRALEDWELRYRKECFYYGIRALLELERQGKTKL
jgi:hypothetical protein